MSTLIASFPAAGSGGETLEQLAKLAARNDLGYTALQNPPSVEALISGQWLAASSDALRCAPADRVVLVGHCMGGLSAALLAAALDFPVGLLLINTPCPDAEGRIPTMSRYGNAEIAEILSHDGFPQDLLDDEDMLAEIADGLRADARVADLVAERVSTAGPFTDMHVLSTRGDFFIPPQHCAGWWARVAGEFQLTVADGGHTIDDDSAATLERIVLSVATKEGPTA